MKANKMIVQNRGNGKGNYKVAAKLQNCPLEQRACLFVLFMGILGGVIGGTSAEIEMRTGADNQRIRFDAVEQRLDGVEKGAYAGMGAATVMSLSAIARRFKR
jgi:hypothetical protein